MSVIRSTQVPLGIWIDAGGLAVNLQSKPTRDFIKACHHMIQLMEGNSEYSNEPPVGDIHPGLQDYLNDLKKKP